MIVSIRHKGLKLLWETGDGWRLPAAYVQKITRILDVLDMAENVPDYLNGFYRWRVHLLRGNYKDFYSLSVSPNYRIIFRFDNGCVYDLDFIDYH